MLHSRETYQPSPSFTQPEMITIILLYLLIALLASVVGSMAGLGGGIIIKPLLDFFNDYDLPTIGVLSAATVLAMATVSLIKLRISKVAIDRKNGFIIAFGSILGGFIGKWIFNFFVLEIGLEQLIGKIQASVLAILLLIIFIYIKFQKNMVTYQMKNKLGILLAGVLLGLIAAFLGIGGGPLNMALLIFFFSMDAKQASINSIYIIFFSQLSSLILVGTTTGFGSYDLSIIWYMILGGSIGGLIGSIFVQKLTSRRIERIFNIVIVIMILINIYNVVKG
ncbi:sulfite exporter TauE/SafE family protein [Paucisalibacillus sp. EB02]|uniref:sulfite exporter TauE/SafE family protein n=1 Tax=Paucisalibacillus sp. EB02 TaxID=1347087 RepID=UPI0004BB485F|nr:sulfite exporter TauE/SafE family protein [Paucisalibacillus sp. EB02]